jgi:hypothetical protein
MNLQAINPMIYSASRYCRQLNVHSRLKNVRNSLHDRKLGAVFGPYSPDLSPRDFHLWGSLKDKLHKTNLHTL